MTPLEAALKKNRKLVYSNLSDKREVRKPKFILSQFVRTADTKRVLVKVIQHIFHIEYTQKTEVIHDAIPSYRFDYSPERYNENLLRSRNLTDEQNNQVMKKPNLVQEYIKQ